MYGGGVAEDDGERAVVERNEQTGLGRETIFVARAIFVIQRDESRGSNVILLACQNLNTPKAPEGVNINATPPSTEAVPWNQLWSGFQNLQHQFLLPRIVVRFERFDKRWENPVEKTVFLSPACLMIVSRTKVVMAGVEVSGVPSAAFEANATTGSSAQRQEEMMRDFGYGWLAFGTFFFVSAVKF